MFLFLSPWETDLRKHWYDLCQRMFCLCSLLGILWCNVKRCKFFIYLACGSLHFLYFNTFVFSFRKFSDIYRPQYCFWSIFLVSSCRILILCILIIIIMSHVDLTLLFKKFYICIFSLLSFSFFFSFLFSFFCVPVLPTCCVGYLQLVVSRRGVNPAR